MSTRSFGAALGDLVRQKRRVQGLTQLQLAEDAFGTSAKVRRISELESGSVANPHPRTIDPIVVTLGITPEEIEECVRKAPTQTDDALALAFREAMSLIDTLAQQFEHDQPSAGLADLDRFLRAKAVEWAALRDRIHSIDAEERAFTRIKDDAERALAEGRLEDVDALLAQAEEQYQRDRTLSEVRKLAGLRITRGDSFLLKGDADAALGFYESAVEFYRPFDEEEMAREINEIAYKVYEISRRSLKPIFYVSASLVELLLTLPSIQVNPSAVAEASYRIGLSYRNEHDDPRSTRSTEALEKAIYYSTQALESATMKSDPYKALASTIGLANCLRDRAKLTSSVPDLIHAIDLLKMASASLGKEEVCASLLPHLYNSLGALLRNAANMKADIPHVDIEAEGLSAFLKAASASEANSDLEVWGAARFNIGALLAERATSEGLDPQESHFLRIRAIADLSAAIETYPATAFPFNFANAQYLLGQVLYRHAASIESDDLCEVYLFRAIQAFEAATNVFEKDVSPKTWASIQMYLGTVFGYHARFAKLSIGLEDIQRTIGYYEEAALVFAEIGAESEVATCQNAIMKAKSERNRLFKLMAEEDLST
jgi:tetratricopeptide (TPR) repeat protein